MNSLLEKLQKQLQKRKEADNFRTLQPQNNLIDFCSNDYLGLAQNILLRQTIEKTLSTLAQPYLGATGSRLLSGTHPHTLRVEQALAEIFEAEACLIFNSGYQANTAILSTIPQKGDTIFCDERIHASLREGARLSLAERFYFRHNDTEDLARKLQKAQEQKFVIVETVYSMEGDIAPIADLMRICTQYNAHLIVDEAHSTGIYGSKGNGYLIEQGLHQGVFARIYTFGKAMGGHGACIVGPQILIDYFINFARSFIYTTALPLHSIVHIQESFRYIGEHLHLQQKLRQNIQDFKNALPIKSANFALKESQTPIQIVGIGGNERTKYFAQAVGHAGFDVRAVLSPTVREGEEIVRICLHAFNTKEQIERLCEEMLKINEEIF